VDGDWLDDYINLYRTDYTRVSPAVFSLLFIMALVSFLYPSRYPYSPPHTHTHTLQWTLIHILIMSYSLGTLQRLHTSHMRY